MRRQKCSQCGTMLDVTSLERGGKFACSNCGTILIVGEAPVAKRSLKDPDKAFTRRAATDDAPSAPTRSRRRSEPSEPRPARAAPPKKNMMPIFAIGGVVVVGAILAIVMSGDKGAGDGGGGEVSKQDWWLGITSKVAVAEPNELRAWLAEARARGYDKDEAFWSSKQLSIYKALLRQDPSDAEANRYAGNKSVTEASKDFAQVWGSMNDNYAKLESEDQAFIDKYQDRFEAKKQYWFAPDEFEAILARLEAHRTWMKERAENPAADAIERATASASQLLNDRAFVALATRPFVVLLAYDKAADNAEAKRAELKAKGNKLITALSTMYASFDKNFGKPLGLVPPTRYLYQVVVEKAEDMRRLGGDGFEVSPECDFIPTTGWGVAHLSTEANLAPHVGTNLAHIGVHQLHWYYSKDPKKKWSPRRFDEWTGLWLTEGWAEYAGSGVQHDVATGKAEFTGFPGRRIAVLQAMKDNGVPLIPLRELVQLNTYREFSQYVGRTWRPSLSEDEDTPEDASNWVRDFEGNVVIELMYAHSYLLTHFMLEGEKGAHRAKYHDLLRTAMNGKDKPASLAKRQGERFASAYEAFRDVMGLTDEGDSWQSLDKKFKRYHSRLLRAAKKAE